MPERLRRPSGLRIAVVSILLFCTAACGSSWTPVVGADPSQQRGFALPTWYEFGYSGPDLPASLSEIEAVGADWVQFTPTYYQWNRSDNQMVRTTKTVSDDGLKRAIELAHQQGLEVLLKPHIDLNPGQDSQNNAVPQDREAWFAAYSDFITHYAEIAQQTGVAQFSVGTELSSLSDDRASWLPVIDEVRAVYDGTVLYAAGRDYATVAFWDKLDLIGIDAYLALGSSPTTDVNALKAAWQPAVDELAAMAAHYGKRVLFTEAGYRSEEGTITDPSNWLRETPVSEEEQAAAYEALLATFTPLQWWAGVFWWVWITPPDRLAEPNDYSPKGKEAETVVRRWWTA